MRPTAPSRRPPAARPPRGLGQPGPAADRLAGLLALAWVEVRTGRRPRDQLAPLVSPAVRKRLAAEAARGGRHPGGPVRIRRVRTYAPRPGAVEATVLVEAAGRTSAVAVRLERHLGAWRAVELSAPESGLPAVPTSSLPDDHRPRDAFDEVLEQDGDPRGPELAPDVRPRGSA